MGGGEEEALKQEFSFDNQQQQCCSPKSSFLMRAWACICASELFLGFPLMPIISAAASNAASGHFSMSQVLEAVCLA